MLTALIADRAETDRTLQRIEQKLDRLADASYAQSLRAGLRLLDDAQPPWRQEQDRERLLHDARSRFVDAAAAASGPVPQALADWHLALAWALSGSVHDSLTALGRARAEAFRAVVEARDSWARPGKAVDEAADASLSSAEQAWKRLFGLDMTQRRRTAQRLLRLDLRERVTEALAVASTVQATYAALGTPAAQCVAPVTLPDPLPDTGEWNQIPEIVVAMVPSAATTCLGHQFTVHELRCASATVEGRRGWVVDVRLGLDFTGGPHDVVRISARSSAPPVGTFDELVLREDSAESLARPFGFPDLPYPRLLADGAMMVASGLIQVSTRAEGWLRLTRLAEPSAIAFRTWPFGQRNTLDRGILAFCPIE